MVTSSCNVCCLLLLSSRHSSLTCVLTEVTAASVVPGALVEVSASVIVRGQLEPAQTGALVTSLRVEAELVTASSAGLATLVQVSTLDTVLAITRVSCPASSDTIISLESRQNGLLE